MKKKLILFVFILTEIAMAQQKEVLPYREIPQSANEYTSGTVASRLVDGLGFRYYWATEGLRPEDLKFKASDSGRTSEETIEHIHGLSKFILNSVSEPSDNNVSGANLDFFETRKQTLLNFEKASAILKNTTNLTSFDNNRYPFWNIINGPISDAIWHCGQVVMLRRASGNPFNSKVSVFSGKLRD